MREEPTRLDTYLDEVAAHLGRRKGRKDLLLELRSSILDRAEELGEGEADAESVDRAIASMGEPSAVALAYAGEKFLIGPKQYRAFLIYTGLVFAIHLVMIIVASVIEADIELFPVLVVPLSNPDSVVNIVAVALQALLLDIGLMVVIFTGIARVQHTVRIPHLAFRVQAGLRPSVGRSVLALLAILILTVFRDRLFVVIIDGVAKPFFTTSFARVTPVAVAFLGLVIAKEILYAWLGERRGLVAADATIAAAGAAMMIWFLTRPPFLSFPQVLGNTTSDLPTLNQVVQKVIALLLISFSAAFAFEATKRFIRLFQIWS